MKITRIRRKASLTIDFFQPGGDSLWMIGVVNYDRGNLRSVSKALEAAGAAVKLVTRPAEMDGLSALVLPGVGAFGDAAHNLNDRGLWQPVKDWIAADRPFLGICLGYQLLFESSEESPGVAGLGVFPGTVKRFPESAGLKVPHMGWNTLHFTQRSCPLWEGLGNDETYVYFVHSYYPAPNDASLVAARASYGLDFAAAIHHGNVMATQFHPEKSQEEGLKMLENFLATLGSTAPLARA